MVFKRVFLLQSEMGLATEQLSKQLLEYEKKVSVPFGCCAPLLCNNISAPLDKLFVCNAYWSFTHFTCT